MRVVGTIEARMGSSRLPGKTLMPVCQDLPLLGLVCERFQRCQTLDSIFVATTVEAGDDAIALWCAANGVNCHRGSEHDVLDRVTQTAVAAQADAIVQMGADSGYLDFELIDRLVAIYRQGGYDYVCNDLELTWPLGIYGHVVSVPKLAELNRRCDLSCHDREDVVRQIFEHPESYRLLNVPAPAEFAYPQLRFTIDYPEDMQLLREVIAELGGHGFTTPDLLELYRKKPALFESTLNLVQMSAPFLKAKANG
jgi:spore coat polysaccharide biosynthesis protein SpsF